MALFPTFPLIGRPPLPKVCAYPLKIRRALNSQAFIDGTKLAYFRGRKLHGKSVKLPEQCRGVVVERRQDKEQQPAAEEPVVVVDDDEAEKEPVGTMQVTAEFDEMVIWGHETVADATGDPYIRSMEEWLQVAGQVSLAFVSTCGLIDTNYLDSLLFRGGSRKVMWMGP